MIEPERKTVKQIKDFKIALKDFEPMVKGVKDLVNGRDITNFSLRPREAWANWLLCVVLQKVNGDDITFVEDTKGDGIILNKGTGAWIRTEHVSAMDTPAKKPLPQGEARVIAAINHKIDRGPDYAKNKNLVVFFDGAGNFYRNKIRESIRGRHNFHMVYAIGLLWSNERGYAYSVTEFHYHESVTFKVVINNDFTDWTIYKILDTHTVSILTGETLSSRIQEMLLP